MRKLILLIALLNGVLAYGQKWEAGGGIALISLKHFSLPPYYSFTGTNYATIIAPNIYVNRKTKHISYDISINYFKRNESSLDTLKVPTGNLYLYPRPEKDSIVFNNAWKSNYYALKFDFDYSLFRFKKLNNYLGLCVSLWLENRQYFQNQTILDNNYKSFYSSTEHLQDVFVGITYKVDYALNKKWEIQNALSGTISTDLYADFSGLNRWPTILSDQIGVGYKF